MANNMQPGTKFWKRVTHLIFIILLIYLIVERSSRRYKVKKIWRFLPDIRYILLWHNISDLEGDGQESFIKYKCPYSNCYLTTNRTLFGNLGYFDAVLFSAQGVSAGSHDLPDLRTAVQKYVFVANDSSDNYPACDVIYDTFFNWTWTYRLESTIGYTFFTIRNLQDEHLGRYFKWITNMTETSDHLKGQLESKSKAAAIFLDKCKSRSKREEYLGNLQKELSKYNLTVDIYGQCGTKSCRRKSMVGCFWRLRQHYYFYLAMEDSIAANYITQEVAFAYENNAVPIVYGSMYSGFLPPFSYLNAIQLNEKMLAQVMNEVIKNKTLYHDFFRWRNHYIIKRTKPPLLNPCDLCKGLNDPHWLTYRTNRFGFRKWWNAFYEDRCKE